MTILELGPGEYSTDASSVRATDRGPQGFSKLPRQICEGTPEPKNPRVGRHKHYPAVGSYNPDTSSFSKAHTGFNYRFY